eukprot:SAG31_NODE_4233_length_3434_cov_1.980810_5_plen_441_part_00
MPSDGHNGAADLGRLGAVYRRRNYADRGPLFTQLLERECGVRYQQPLVADSMLRYLCSTDEATFHMYSAAAGTPVPPFTISFSTVVCDGHLLAVGDEEGYVSLLDTSVPVEYDHWGRLLPRPGGHSFWQAHRNAIMAIAWAERDTKLLVASADQTVTEWDVESRRLVCTMQGHRGTVTCLATNPTQPTECVSGGRDGALLFWDRRQSGGSCGSGRRRGGPVIANLQAAGGSEASTVTSLAAYRTIANLESSDIKQKIHSILHHEGGRPYREGEILSRLQQKEIVDELVKTLQGSTSGSQVGSGAPPVVDSGRGTRILLRLRGGVAFSDALRLSNSLGDEAGSEEDPLSFVQIHVCYAGQRFVSPAVPFTDRPELVAAFSMDMGTRSRNDYIAMLTKTPATPIHFVATRITKHDGDRPTIVVSLTVSPYAYSSICCQRSSY